METPIVSIKPISTDIFMKAAARKTLAQVIRENTEQTGTIRLGVLIPRQTICPGREMNLLDGMKTYLAWEVGGRQIELVYEQVDNSLAAMEGALASLNGQGLYIIIGLMTPTKAELLLPSLINSGTLLIAASLGADSIHPNQYNPHILYATLGYWQANWALGNHAARTIGGRGLVAANFYESRYQSLEAFRYGFLMGGGRAIRTHITGRPGVRQDMGRVIQEIIHHAPDFVHVMYSGEAAQEFAAAYAKERLTIPIVGSQVMMESVDVGLPWATVVGTELDEDFKIGFKAMTGRRPDSLAALGHDVMRRLTVGISGRAGFRESFRRAGGNSPVFGRELLTEVMVNRIAQYQMLQSRATPPRKDAYLVG